MASNPLDMVFDHGGRLVQAHHITNTAPALPEPTKPTFAEVVGPNALEVFKGLFVSPYHAADYLNNFANADEFKQVVGLDPSVTRTWVADGIRAAQAEIGVVNGVTDDEPDTTYVWNQERQRFLAASEVRGLVRETALEVAEAKAVGESHPAEGGWTSPDHAPGDSPLAGAPVVPGERITSDLGLATYPGLTNPDGSVDTINAKPASAAVNTPPASAGGDTTTLPPKGASGAPKGAQKAEPEGKAKGNRSK